MPVRRTRVTVAVGAVLLWAVTPVLACVLPCLAIASANQECSHHMAMDCGGSMITASRTCCQISSQSEIATLEIQVSQLQKRVMAAAVVAVHVSLPDVSTTGPAALAFSESPPREALPLSCSVLRI